MSFTTPMATRNRLHCCIRCRQCYLRITLRDGVTIDPPSLTAVAAAVAVVVAAAAAGGGSWRSAAPAATEKTDACVFEQRGENHDEACDEVDVDALEIGNFGQRGVGT